MKKGGLLLAAIAWMALFATLNTARAPIWIQTSAPITNWSAVASSADGTKLVAAVKGGPIYTSLDSGVTWTPSSALSTNWSSVASSADGSKLVASVAVYNGSQYEAGGPIYTSTNAGATWTQTSAPITNWAAIASSSDGGKLVAVVGGGAPPAPPGPVFISEDSGATWIETSAPNAAYNDVPRADWSSVASSADGAKLIAAVNGGGIWILQTTPELGLSIAPAGTEIVLSWVVPSLGFALQENSDLNTTNWTEVSITPTLNLTNLHNQVTAPLPTGNRFYRLKN